MNETSQAIRGLRGQLKSRFRRGETGSLSVEPRRALAVFRALNLSGDKKAAENLLKFSGRPANEMNAPLTIRSGDCDALATNLRDAGYPLTDDGIQRFKMERGFSNVVRIGPDVAAAYDRLAQGIETRINIRDDDWKRLGKEIKVALRILLLIGRDPGELLSIRQALGVRDSEQAPEGVLLVGEVTARRLLQWARRSGWTFDSAGLSKIAHVRKVDTPAVDKGLASFVADAVLGRGEPTHDYRRVTRDQCQLNRRTHLMLNRAEMSLPPNSTLLKVVKGSYIESDGRGAHPHMGGGVVDLALLKSDPRMIERVVLTLREVGFAAWSRPRSNESHIHAVAIGDREMSPSAWWQVKAFFRGRDGRTRSQQDPHHNVRTSAPSWVERYRIPAL